jgi:hypothetical protein
MTMTVAEPCDSGGCATLISDTGYGRTIRVLAAGERPLSQKRTIRQQIQAPSG